MSIEVGINYYEIYTSDLHNYSCIIGIAKFRLINIHV